MISHDSVENRNKAIFVAPKVDGVTLNMELDMGSAASVIAKDDYIKKFPNRKRLTKTKFLNFHMSSAKI
jgi:hypothetical protein